MVRIAKTRGVVRMRALPGLVLLALAAAAFAGCDREAPLSPTTDETLPAADRVLGLVEVTITGLGTGQVTSSALSAPDIAALERLHAARAGRASQAGGPSTTGHGAGDVAHEIDAGSARASGGLALESLTPPANADASGEGTIQLEPLATGSFTDGERGAGGVRHLWATFRVRNADTLGTAYDTERQNLTFLAVGTDGSGGTLDETAISTLRRFDGTPASAAIAAAVLPTGSVVKDPRSSTIESAGPDVLQLLTEAEAAAVESIAPAGVATVFPYGFVVRNPSTLGSRALPASPAADRFDGLVTFAFKVPLQAAADEDPFTVSILFLAVDDSEVRVTQSLEEQSPAARAAVELRAAMLGGSLTLLPGGGAALASVSERVLCEVRTAGFTSATATLFPPPSGGPWLVPGAQGAGPYFIGGNAQLGAARCPAIAAADAGSFVVHGFQSGPPAGAYTGAGTPLVHAPAGDFFPGEVVEVTLTTGLGGTEPVVARYRVLSAPGSGDVAPAAASPVAVGTGPRAVASADLDGDGDLDLATANADADGVSVLLGDGTGAFAAAVDYAVGDAPADIAAGDLNGDGDLDLATASMDGNAASVLLNNGDGTFGAAAGYAVGSAPQSIAIADLDGDGDLDLATANLNSDNVSVLLNDGSGGFAAVEYGAGAAPADLAVGDLDEDGDLDLAIASATSIASLSVLMNDDDGTFAPVVQHPAGFFGGTGSFDGIAIADFDGDGHLDVAMELNAVLGPSTIPAVIVLGNQGDGAFAISTFFPLVSASRLVTAADLDGDRAMDLVLLRGDDLVYTRINAGDGTFKEGTSHGVGTAPAGAAVAELDGDARLDLAVVNSGSNDVSVLLQQ